MSNLENVLKCTKPCRGLKFDLVPFDGLLMALGAIFMSIMKKLEATEMRPVEACITDIIYILIPTISYEGVHISARINRTTVLLSFKIIHVRL